jgi:drug/metabolite transporter (DMT)-like permease
MQSNGIRTNYSNMDPSGGAEVWKPSSSTINIALVTAQVIFGVSAVVGAIGLPSFHPLTFALIREACATIVLLTAAHFVSLRAGRENGVFSGSFQEDLPKFVISGIGIFGSQAFYIIGIKLSSAVAASVWQPTQPILTAAVSMILGMEPFSFERCVGILVAFFGCAIMVLGGGGSAGEAIGGEGGDNGAFSQLMGQFSFFLNCCGASLYVLSSKTIIKTGRYESVAVTGWSYAVASVLMLVFAILLSFSEGISRFLCSDCSEDIWHVPKSAIPAMVFFIFFTSSISYGLITWENKHASGTMVIGYSVLQPVASAVVIQLLVSMGLYEGCKAVHRFLEDASDEEVMKACLELPDKFTFIGGIGVFCGLMAVIYTEPKAEKEVENITVGYEEDEHLLELTELDGFEGYSDDES